MNVRRIKIWQGMDRSMMFLAPQVDLYPCLFPVSPSSTLHNLSRYETMRTRSGSVDEYCRLVRASIQDTDCAVLERVLS